MYSETGISKPNARAARASFVPASMCTLISSSHLPNGLLVGDRERRVAVMRLLLRVRQGACLRPCAVPEWPLLTLGSSREDAARC